MAINIETSAEYVDIGSYKKAQESSNKSYIFVYVVPEYLKNI